MINVPTSDEHTALVERVTALEDALEDLEAIVDEILAPDPEELPDDAYVVSGPIVAVSGQLITGVRITGVSGTAITVRDVTDVTILDVQIEGTGGHGHGVLIQNAQRVKVLNSTIKPGRNNTTLDTQHAVCLRDSSEVLIQGNRIEEAESSIHAVGGHTITVKGNYSKNPLGPFPRGQHVQMYPVNQRGPIERRAEITDNYFVSDDATPHSGGVGIEDCVNIGDGSAHAYVARNYIIGGKARSGCGVIFEGQSDHGVAEDNVLIKTNNCGVSVTNSAWATVRRNKVLDTYVDGASGNTGIVVWYDQRGSTAVCHDNRVEENVVSNLLPSGAYNDIWVKAGTGTQAGNTKGVAARALLTPPPPPPAIPPLPWTP